MTNMVEWQSAPLPKTWAISIALAAANGGAIVLALALSNIATQLNEIEAEVRLQALSGALEATNYEAVPPAVLAIGWFIMLLLIEATVAGAVAALVRTNRTFSAMVETVRAST